MSVAGTDWLRARACHAAPPYPPFRTAACPVDACLQGMMTTGGLGGVRAVDERDQLPRGQDAV